MHYLLQKAGRKGNGMKKLNLVLSLFLLIPLGGCGPKKPEESAALKEDNSLIVYTSSNQAILDVLEPAAEKALGLEIEYISLASGEGYARVVAERENPQADVYNCGGPAEIDQDTSLFAPYVSPHNDELPEAIRATDGYAAITGGNTSVIIYNKDLCPFEITGYEDLLDPRLKGHIAFGDAVASNSAYYHLENMLVDMGGNPAENSIDEKGWSYVRSFLENLDGRIIDSSSAVYKGVAAGEYWVGLTYDVGAVNIIADGAENVAICLMKEGIITKTGGAAIIANCAHPDNAKKYLDWLTSKEWEEQKVKIPGCIPVRTDLDIPEYNDIGITSETVVWNCPSTWTAQHKEEIVAKYQSLLEEMNFGS